MCKKAEKWKLVILIKLQVCRHPLGEMFTLCVMEEFGNPFEEESQDFLVLDTKEIATQFLVPKKLVRISLTLSLKNVVSGQDQAS